jgi:hypothetical protein
VPSLEDDAIVEILLSEDYGDEVVPSKVVRVWMIMLFVPSDSG